MNFVLRDEGINFMRSAIWAIVLILFSACPAELSAQAAPHALQADTTTEALPTLKPHNPASHSELGKKPDGSSSLFTVVASLVLVLGIFFAVAWMFRRVMPPSAGPLPTEAFEVLGRGHLANRQQAHLLRCGNKLLLVSAGATGVTPLTEITDAAEVDRLTNLCRQSRPNVATTALRNVFGKGKDNG
jgi:flagellar biogenesis protein FliO